MAPISLNLIDLGSKPVHACPYTVPRSLEQQLRKEIARLVDIGVLEEDYNNGTVQIQKGIVPERVNIRRISPFQLKTHNLCIILGVNDIPLS
jgi:hypothetical protein